MDIIAGQYAGPVGVEAKKALLGHVNSVTVANDNVYFIDEDAHAVFRVDANGRLYLVAGDRMGMASVTDYGVDAFTFTTR